MADTESDEDDLDLPIAAALGADKTWKSTIVEISSESDNGGVATPTSTSDEDIKTKDETKRLECVRNNSDKENEDGVDSTKSAEDDSELLDVPLQDRYSFMSPKRPEREAINPLSDEVYRAELLDTVSHSARKDDALIEGNVASFEASCTLIHPTRAFNGDSPYNTSLGTSISVIAFFEFYKAHMAVLKLALPDFSNGVAGLANALRKDEPSESDDSLISNIGLTFLRLISPSHFLERDWIDVLDEFVSETNACANESVTSHSAIQLLALLVEENRNKSFRNNYRRNAELRFQLFLHLLNSAVEGNALKSAQEILLQDAETLHARRSDIQQLITNIRDQTDKFAIQVSKEWQDCKGFKLFQVMDEENIIRDGDNLTILVKEWCPGADVLEGGQLILGKQRFSVPWKCPRKITVEEKAWFGVTVFRGTANVHSKPKGFLQIYEETTAVLKAYKKLTGDNEPSWTQEKVIQQLELEMAKYTHEGHDLGRRKEGKLRTEPLGVDGFDRRFWVLESDPMYVFVQSSNAGNEVWGYFEGAKEIQRLMESLNPKHKSEAVLIKALSKHLKQIVNPIAKEQEQLLRARLKDERIKAKEEKALQIQMEKERRQQIRQIQEEKKQQFKAAAAAAAEARIQQIQEMKAKLFQTVSNQSILPNLSFPILPVAKFTECANQVVPSSYVRLKDIQSLSSEGVSKEITSCDGLSSAGIAGTDVKWNGFCRKDCKFDPATMPGSKFMVECAGCKIWYHGHCVHVSKCHVAGDNVVWVCSRDCEDELPVCVRMGKRVMVGSTRQLASSREKSKSGSSTANGSSTVSTTTDILSSTPNSVSSVLIESSSKVLDPPTQIASPAARSIGSTSTPGTSQMTAEFDAKTQSTRRAGRSMQRDIQASHYFEENAASKPDATKLASPSFKNLIELASALCHPISVNSQDKNANGLDESKNEEAKLESSKDFDCVSKKLADLLDAVEADQIIHSNEANSEDPSKERVCTGDCCFLSSKVSTNIGKFMVECAACHICYHAQCVRVSKRHVTSDGVTWVCCADCEDQLPVSLRLGKKVLVGPSQEVAVRNTSARGKKTLRESDDGSMSNLPEQPEVKCKTFTANPSQKRQKVPYIEEMQAAATFLDALASDDVEVASKEEICRTVHRQSKQRQNCSKVEDLHLRQLALGTTQSCDERDEVSNFPTDKNTAPDSVRTRPGAGTRSRPARKCFRAMDGAFSKPLPLIAEDPVSNGVPMPGEVECVRICRKDCKFDVTIRRAKDFMVECAGCNIWYHGSCVDVSESDVAADDVVWVCSPDCEDELPVGIRQGKKVLVGATTVSTAGQLTTIELKQSRRKKRSIMEESHLSPVEVVQMDLQASQSSEVKEQEIMQDDCTPGLVSREPIMKDKKRKVSVLKGTVASKSCKVSASPVYEVDQIHVTDTKLAAFLCTSLGVSMSRHKLNTFALEYLRKQDLLDCTDSNYFFVDDKIGAAFGLKGRCKLKKLAQRIRNLVAAEHKGETAAKLSSDRMDRTPDRKNRSPPHCDSKRALRAQKEQLFDKSSHCPPPLLVVNNITAGDSDDDNAPLFGAEKCSPVKSTPNLAGDAKVMTPSIYGSPLKTKLEAAAVNDAGIVAGVDESSDEEISARRQRRKPRKCVDRSPSPADIPLRQSQVASKPDDSPSEAPEYDPRLEAAVDAAVNAISEALILSAFNNPSLCLQDSAQMNENNVEGVDSTGKSAISSQQEGMPLEDSSNVSDTGPMEFVADLRASVSENVCGASEMIMFAADPEKILHNAEEEDAIAEEEQLLDLFDAAEKESSTCQANISDRTSIPTGAAPPANHLHLNDNTITPAGVNHSPQGAALLATWTTVLGGDESADVTGVRAAAAEDAPDADPNPATSTANTTPEKHHEAGNQEDELSESELKALLDSMEEQEEQGREPDLGESAAAGKAGNAPGDDDSDADISLEELERLEAMAQ